MGSNRPSAGYATRSLAQDDGVIAFIQDLSHPVYGHVTGRELRLEDRGVLRVHRNQKSARGLRVKDDAHQGLVTPRSNVHVISEAGLTPGRGATDYAVTRERVSPLEDR